MKQKSVYGGNYCEIDNSTGILKVVKWEVLASYSLLMLVLTTGEYDTTKKRTNDLLK